MGNVPVRACFAGDLAHDDEQHDHADDAADGLEDVVRARLIAQGVDVMRLDAAHLATHDGLRVRAVEELVDRGRQTLPGLLNLVLEV
jgi:hypothetical protein